MRVHFLLAVFSFATTSTLSNYLVSHCFINTRNVFSQRCVTTNQIKDIFVNTDASSITQKVFL